jgi:hypothetical protein
VKESILWVLEGLTGMVLTISGCPESHVPLSLNQHFTLLRFLSTPPAFRDTLTAT